MRYPQILIYEHDQQLASIFRREGERRQTAGERRTWALREPRGLESCLQLLGQAGPNVLVLRLSKDPVRELTLLDRATWQFPETAAIVVADTDDPEVAGLAWDLGASFVLLPDVPRQQIIDLASSLLLAAAAPPATDSSAESAVIDLPVAEED